jgi:hypothetical protein
MLDGSHWILERLRELEREKLQREEDNRREHALTAFLRALNETEIYYGSLRDSDKDRDREEELSRLWIDVSRELLVVDVELAKRCEAKAKYWADPIGWTPQAVERAQIAIHEMRSALHQLIDRETERRGQHE